MECVPAPEIERLIQPPEVRLPPAGPPPLERECALVSFGPYQTTSGISIGATVRRRDGKNVGDRVIGDQVEHLASQVDLDPLRLGSLTRRGYRLIQPRPLLGQKRPGPFQPMVLLERINRSQGLPAKHPIRIAGMETDRVEAELELADPGAAVAGLERDAIFGNETGVEVGIEEFVVGKAS